jgi:hypothetical protein
MRSSVQKIGKSASKRSLEPLEKGGLSTDELRQLHKESERDLKKISHLEKELSHYKRLCQRQKSKIEEYRAMEIEFHKLSANFAKSEQIRKQQKRIIETLKPKS